MNSELKWHPDKVKIITWDFSLSNGMIACVRNVVIALIEKGAVFSQPAAGMLHSFKPESQVWS